MTCDTLIRIDPDGRKIWKSKNAYNTQDEAILVAKQVNSQENRIGKVVPYRCNYCNKYHLGRNGKEITEKYKNKLLNDPDVKIKKILNPKKELKIVGWIDLSKVNGGRQSKTQRKFASQMLKLDKKLNKIINKKEND